MYLNSLVEISHIKFSVLIKYLKFMIKFLQGMRIVVNMSKWLILTNELMHYIIEH